MNWEPLSVLIVGHSLEVIITGKDLINHRFGKLVVVSRAPDGKAHDSRWNCVCDCGNHTVVFSSHLASGRSQSCGCLRVESSDITGERRGDLVAVRKTGCQDKYGKNIYLWQCNCGFLFYHTASTRLSYCPECRKRIKQIQAEEMRQKRVVDPSTGMDMTSLRNLQEGKLTKANTSGVRGVYWNDSKQKWIATGRIGGRLRELGHFDSLQEAKEERELFVSKYYAPTVL